MRKVVADPQAFAKGSDTILEPAEPASALFDLDTLEAETQDFVREREDLINAAAKRMARDAVKIGGYFAEVKDRLSPAQFERWRETRMGWSERTVYNLIAVYAKFSTANFAIENVAASALYLLAAPSTPAHAVEAVKQLADEGPVSHAVVKEVIEQAKDAEEVANRPPLFEATAAEETAEDCGCGHPRDSHTPENARYEPASICATATQPAIAVESESAAGVEPAAPVVATPTTPMKPAAAAGGKPADSAKKALPTTEQLKAESEADKAWRAHTIRLSVSLMPVKAGVSRETLVTVTVSDRPELMRSQMVPECDWPATLTELSAQVKEALAKQPTKATPVITTAKTPAKPTKPAAKPPAKPKNTKPAKKGAKK